MKELCLTVDNNPQLETCMTFKDVKAIDRYYCGKILRYSYDSKDDFSRSSDLFYEMGRYVNKFSDNTCYAISAFSLSLSDFARWGNAKSEGSGKTNKEIIGKNSFGEKVAKICDDLYEAIAKLDYDEEILLPKICCAEGQFSRGLNYQCSSTGNDEGISFEYFQEMGCPYTQACGWDGEFGKLI